MRLIDADELKYKNIAEVNGILTHVLTAEEIDNAPTVEPFAEVHFETFREYERPHGKWIKLRDYDFKCSYCGFSIMDKYNFCPECGAEMRGNKNEID